jgi:hypothetical protein
MKLWLLRHAQPLIAPGLCSGHCGDLERPNLAGLSCRLPLVTGVPCSNQTSFNKIKG